MCTQKVWDNFSFVHLITRFPSVAVIELYEISLFQKLIRQRLDNAAELKTNADMVSMTSKELATVMNWNQSLESDAFVGTF